MKEEPIIKIKVLGLNYDIKFVEEENIAGLYGEVIHQKNLIRLNIIHPPGRMKQALIHEIMHIIDVEFKLNLNEDTIERLSNVWHAIIVDNPHIFKYNLNET